MRYFSLRYPETTQATCALRASLSSNKIKKKQVISYLAVLAPCGLCVKTKEQLISNDESFLMKRCFCTRGILCLLCYLAQFSGALRAWTPNVETVFFLMKWPGKTFLISLVAFFQALHITLRNGFWITSNVPREIGTIELKRYSWDVILDFMKTDLPSLHPQISLTKIVFYVSDTHYLKEYSNAYSSTTAQPNLKQL